MNTSVSAVLYTSKRLRNGEHPLMLRLTKNRKLKYISLHLSLDAKYWDAAKGKPKRNCPDRDKILHLIEQKTKELQEQIIDFKTNDKDYTLHTEHIQLKSPVSFCPYKHIKTRRANLSHNSKCSEKVRFALGFLKGFSYLYI